MVWFHPILFLSSWNFFWCLQGNGIDTRTVSGFISQSSAIATTLVPIGPSMSSPIGATIGAKERFGAKNFFILWRISYWCFTAPWVPDPSDRYVFSHRSLPFCRDLLQWRSLSLLAHFCAVLFKNAVIRQKGLGLLRSKENSQAFLTLSIFFSNFDFFFMYRETFRSLR